jgi:hypothetical protein
MTTTTTTSSFRVILWILLVVLLFSAVAGAWIQRVILVEGYGSSNTTTQPGASVANNHSKNISSVEKALDDLDEILNPILNQVTQDNQMIKVVVEKDPKTSYSSPDIVLGSDDNIMRITLPKGIDGEKGASGKRGPDGPVGDPGPRGPRGGK